MPKIKLSPRLAAIAGYIKDGSNVVDVGSDHGHIPVYLAQSGAAGRIIASDIGEGPLMSARRTASEYGVEDRIRFVRAPGLSGIREGEADTVIIAGMGGETIAGILGGAEWTKRAGISLILQPQTKMGKLCSWLLENGYGFNNARLVSDSGRIYVIISSGPGEYRECGILPESELFEFFKRNRDPLFDKYIDTLIAKTCRALEGMARSGGIGYLCMKARLDELMALRSVKGEQIDGHCKGNTRLFK